MLPNLGEMRNFHLVPLFSGIINLLLAICVLTVRPKRRLNRIFFGLGCTVAWWNLGMFTLCSSVQNATLALFQLRLTTAGVVFLPALIYHFAAESTGAGCRSWKIRVAYVVSALFCCLSCTPYIIEDVYPYQQYFRPNPGSLFWTFSVLFFPVAGLGAISSLVLSLNETSSSAIRSTKLLIVAFSILLAGVFHDTIPVFARDFYPGNNMRIVPWGTLAASVYGLIIAYSVFSDQLLDVRVSISRHSATVLRLGFFGSIAFVSMLAVGVVFPGTFSARGLMMSVAVMFVTASITIYFFPKLLGGVTKHIAKGVLGDHFEYQDKVRGFIDAPHEAGEPQQLLDDTATLVINQFSLTEVGLAIVGGDTQTRGETIRSAEPLACGRLLKADSPLIRFFRTNAICQIHVRNGFRIGAEEREISSLLQVACLHHAFAIGSSLSDPLGVLVIGPRRDGRQLTELDIELLQALCRNLVSRIERIAIFQNEKLRQANEAKDRFLASINHEIRNPLNGITGIVQMLKEGRSAPPSHFLLSTLQSCTDQLRSSMDEVLDFTCIESDQVTLTSLEVNLSELIRTTCASHDLSGKLVIFEGVLERDAWVNCDAGKVRQIISNYIANAVKYGVPIGGKVRLLIDKAEPGFVNVKITVTSTGPTLSREERGALFTALTRGRRARETKAHGTGLGLALCKKFANAMDATVGVESEDGLTTFWFAAKFPHVGDHSAPSYDVSSRFSGRRALAIEDEPYNRLVLGHYFKKLGIDPVWAEDGQSALTAVNSEVFDVIFMDWLLPDMDGSELLEKAKYGRSTALPPVIVLSAYSTTSKRSECLAAGAVAFISKPLDLRKLSGALEECHLAASPRKAVFTAQAQPRCAT